MCCYFSMENFLVSVYRIQQCDFPFPFTWMKLNDVHFSFRIYTYLELVRIEESDGNNIVIYEGVDDIVIYCRRIVSPRNLRCWMENM